MIRKPIKKLDAIDKKTIEIQVEIASLAIEPDEFHYRSVFRGLMPKLYFMRKRGIGYSKIHELLNKVGLPITMSTLKTYYSEELAGMMQECETYFRKAEQTRAEIDMGQANEIDRANTVRAIRVPNVAAVNAAAERNAAAEQQIVNEIVSHRNTGTAAGALMAPDLKTGMQAMPAPPQMQKEAASMAATPSKARAQPALNVAVADATEHKPRVPSAVIRNNQGKFANDKTQPLVAAIAGTATCITIPDRIVVERRPGVPPQVYEEGLLEHPAISGLMLTLDQRVTPGKLEYRNAAGEECFEKGSQALNRLAWTKPMAATVSRTSGDFVEMDTSVLGKRPADM